MSLQKKVAAISQKIDALKTQQLELEKSISSQLFDLIKSVDAFSIPFPTLVGAIIAAIEKSKNNSKQSEEWHLAGEKFLKAKSKSTKSVATNNI